jgi:choline dehydrogenase-like flavoprotein
MHRFAFIAACLSPRGPRILISLAPQADAGGARNRAIKDIVGPISMHRVGGSKIVTRRASPVAVHSGRDPLIEQAAAVQSEAPHIRFNYMNHPDDWTAMRAAVRLIREIFAQPAFDRYRGREIQPGDGVQTDTEIDAFEKSRAPIIRAVRAGWGGWTIRGQWSIRHVA